MITKRWIWIAAALLSVSVIAGCAAPEEATNDTDDEPLAENESPEDENQTLQDLANETAEEDNETLQEITNQTG